MILDLYAPESVRTMLVSRSIMMLLEVYDVYVWCDKSDSGNRSIGEWEKQRYLFTLSP